MSRLLAGFINATERAYEEKMLRAEELNNRLQTLAILKVRAEITEMIQSKWEWVESLPDDFKENPLFIENIKEELRQEASQMIFRQKEMGMDKRHLQMLETMLEIS